VVELKVTQRCRAMATTKRNTKWRKLEKKWTSLERLREEKQCEKNRWEGERRRNKTIFLRVKYVFGPFTFSEFWN